jgi:hypothetical protein
MVFQSARFEPPVGCISASKFIEQSRKGFQPYL